MTTTMMLTSKAMTCVFTDENHAFYGLRHYLHDDTFEMLDFVRKISGDVNERIDIFHSVHEAAKLLVSFELPVDDLYILKGSR
jgi:hypothetical protein